MSPSRPLRHRQPPTAASPRALARLALLAAVVAAAAGAPRPLPATPAGAPFPWRAAGLDERQAAAHLLSRFTFGARPGDVDAVVAEGLERWFERQLAADLPDPALARRLAPLRSLAMPGHEMATTYPNAGLVLLAARREGLVAERGEEQARRDPQTRQALVRFAQEQGWRRQGELLGELLTWKVVRAAHAEAQLAEVMADFWFNHFNVSLTDPETRSHVLAYERDAIRAHGLARFDALLEATARHPAMLLYLDNARSMAPAGSETTLSVRLARRRATAGAGFAGMRGGGGMGRGGGAGALGRGGLGGRAGFAGPARGEAASGGVGSAPARGNRGTDTATPAARGRQRSEGINENYARELLELHTLGVDGGYTQQDVVEVARAFSGWSVVPPRALAENVDERLALAARLDAGFVRDGAFLFRADGHDAGAKVVLGTRLRAGRGIEDGEQVLAIVAAHPSTARHLARKLAVRFVADAPPDPLVDRLAAAFAASGGDTRAVLRALVRSPEFWAARGQKVKTPFEHAVASVRALGGEVSGVAGLVDWVERMGQPLYRQEAPTGWPDAASAWVNTGLLVARMNFGLELAAGRVAGVDLPRRPPEAAVAAGSPPEAAGATLAAWAALLLPTQSTADRAAMVERLAPLVGDPGLGTRLASEESPVAAAGMAAMTDSRRLNGWEDPFPGYQRGGWVAPAEASLEARVVGVLLGSPEMQRR